MRARGLEIETDPTVSLYDLANIGPTRLREIADLLEADPVYQSISERLGSPLILSPRIWNSLIEARARRVREFLIHPSPQELPVK